MSDTKAPSFEERVFVMRKFLASIGEEEAARFVSHVDEAVDGLSINHTAFVEEYKKLLDTIAQLREEIDHYDKICTEVRNILTACDIPELTGDRLTVLPLATRVYLLGTIGAKEMERGKQLRAELDEARSFIKGLVQSKDIHDFFASSIGINAEKWLSAHPEETK